MAIWAVRVHSRHFNGRQPSGLGKNNLEGGVGGLMRGIKIPQQEFVRKMQGGLCAMGGVFAGHYGSHMSLYL